MTHSRNRTIISSLLAIWSAGGSAPRKHHYHKKSRKIDDGNGKKTSRRRIRPAQHKFHAVIEKAGRQEQRCNQIKAGITRQRCQKIQDHQKQQRQQGLQLYPTTSRIVLTRKNTVPC